MVAKATKKQPAKQPAKKAAPKKAKAQQKVTPPSHPLMVNGKDWDREKVMDHICDQLATSSRGIGKILSAGFQSHDLPSYSTVMKWLSEDETLSEKYAHAKEAQADFMADELLEIADNASNDWMEREDPDNPGFALNGEHIQRSRLRVDTRKWLAAKLKPKKYGEKLELDGKVEHHTVVIKDFTGKSGK